MDVLHSAEGRDRLKRMPADGGASAFLGDWVPRSEWRHLGGWAPLMVRATPRPGSLSPTRILDARGRRAQARRRCDGARDTAWKPAPI